MTIKTVPFAELDIVTTYPDGTTNNPQTRHAKADAEGIYVMKYKLNDFRYIGVIKTAVVATSKTKTSEAVQVFALQPWSAETNDYADERYVHPLVP
jgi:FAD synthase